MLQLINRSPVGSIVVITIVVTFFVSIGAFIFFGEEPRPADSPPSVTNVIPAPEVKVEIDRAGLALNEQLSIYRSANRYSGILALIAAITTTVVGIATAAIKSDNNGLVKTILVTLAIAAAICTGVGTSQGDIAKNALEGATEIETVVNAVLDDIEKDPSPSQNIRCVLKLQKVIGKYSSANSSPNASTERDSHLSERESPQLTLIESDSPPPTPPADHPRSASRT